MRFVAAMMMLALAPIAANATSIEANIEYTLENHPDGGAASPYYGLRLDGIGSGDTREVYTFDFEAAGSEMTMIYDDVAGTLTISGTAFGGRDGGSDFVSGTTDVWAISFTYTDVYSCGDSLCANSGIGSVSSLLFGSYDLVSEMGNHDYAFQLGTGHRGFTGTSGWGWMNHCPSGEGHGEGQYSNGVGCDNHLYASDWLFTVVDVPAPGTLALLGLGLAMVGFRKKA